MIRTNLFIVSPGIQTHLTGVEQVQPYPERSFQNPSGPAFLHFQSQRPLGAIGVFGIFPFADFRIDSERTLPLVGLKVPMPIVYTAMLIGAVGLFLSIYFLVKNSKDQNNSSVTPHNEVPSPNNLAEGSLIDLSAIPNPQYVEFTPGTRVYKELNAVPRAAIMAQDDGNLSLWKNDSEWTAAVETETAGKFSVVGAKQEVSFPKGRRVLFCRPNGGAFVYSFRTPERTRLMTSTGQDATLTGDGTMIGDEGLTFNENHRAIFSPSPHCTKIIEMISGYLISRSAHCSLFNPTTNQFEKMTAGEPISATGGEIVKIQLGSAIYYFEAKKEGGFELIVDDIQEHITGRYSRDVEGTHFSPEIDDTVPTKAAEISNTLYELLTDQYGTEVPRELSAIFIEKGQAKSTIFFSRRRGPSSQIIAMIVTENGPPVKGVEEGNKVKFIVDRGAKVTVAVEYYRNGIPYVTQRFSIPEGVL